MVTAMSATRTYPKDSFSYKLSLQDDAFFLLRLFGLSERSSLIVEKRVSIWFKLYSGTIAAIASVFAVMNIASVIFPHIAVAPMFHENISAAQRSVYPLWCTMCAILRICVSCTTLSKKFARTLERATMGIQSDASLAKFWIPSRKHLFVTRTASLMALVFLISANLSMYAKLSQRTFLELVTFPMAYLFLLENLVFASSFLGSCIFLVIISKGNLSRMFWWVDSEVEKWCHGDQEKSQDVLEAVMERHNLCWQLTDSYDRVFRTVLGITFVFCVPIFCLVTTQVVRIYTERNESERMLALVSYLLLWSFSCIFFLSLMCTLAASINSAAAAPRKHLMQLTKGHNVRILHFLSRLNEHKIGFTFFSFFVIERTTILTIFSLMITYLVVFLQMAQADSMGSTGSQPSTPL